MRLIQDLVTTNPSLPYVYILFFNVECVFVFCTKSRIVTNDEDMYALQSIWFERIKFNFSKIQVNRWDILRDLHQSSNIRSYV